MLRSMARLLLALVWIMSAASLARADVAAAPDKVELVYQGQEGVWLRKDVAQHMLGDLRAVPLYQERIKLLEQNVSMQDDLIITHARVTKLAQNEADQASGVLEASISEVKMCEEELHSWKHDGGLWFMIGATVATIVVLGGVLSMVTFAH